MPVSKDIKEFSKPRMIMRNPGPILLCFGMILIGQIFLSCGSDSMEVVDTVENFAIPEVTPGNNASPDELKESITAVLLDNGHSELMEALDYVNSEIYTQLVELFAEQKEQHTLFAPKNEAFFKLYDCLGMQTQDISELGDPGLVRDILLYHVARGSFDSNSIIPIENENQVPTLYGKSITINKDRTIQSVGSVAVIGPDDADKKAKNGIVHVIDEVLLPFEVTCVDGN